MVFWLYDVTAAAGLAQQINGCATGISAKLETIQLNPALEKLGVGRKLW